MSSTFYLESQRRWVVAWTDYSGRRRQRRFPDERSARSFTPNDERPSQRDTRPPEVKFAERHRVDSNGCWVWIHSKTPDGYAQMSIDGDTTLMHRWSFERHVARIGDGLHIDHLCRNRACVNPAHLEPVTPRENVMRSPIAQGALNAAKTHCAQGHEYSPENTYWYTTVTPRSTTFRTCKTCRAEWSRKSRSRRLAKTEAVSA